MSTDLRDEGVALLRTGDFAAAAQILTSAVEADASDEAAWRFLGAALSSTGDYGRAVPAFERAVALAPQNARNYYNLALAYQATQREADARTAAAKSVTLDSSYQPAKQLLQTLGGVVPPPTAPTAASMSSAIPPPLGAPAPVAAPTSMAGLTPPTLPSSGGLTPPTPPAAPATPPAASPPTGMPGLGAIGGGMASLGSLGGGPIPSAPAAPTAPAAPPAYSPPGLASVGGASPALREASPAMPPPAYTPPAPTGMPGSYAPTPVLGGGYASGMDQGNNTSGTDGPPPPGATGGWNWGAFAFSWIWLLAHGYVLWGIVVLVVRLGLSATSFAMHLNFLGYVSLAIDIYLGVNGNRLGWRGRRFDSVDDYRACEGIWARWALGIIAVSVVLGFGIGFLVVMAAMRKVGH